MVHATAILFNMNPSAESNGCTFASREGAFRQSLYLFGSDNSHHHMCFTTSYHLLIYFKQYLFINYGTFFNWREAIQDTNK
jgi:hypothetical protein